MKDINFLDTAANYELSSEFIKAYNVSNLVTDKYSYLKLSPDQQKVLVRNA